MSERDNVISYDPETLSQWLLAILAQVADIYSIIKTEKLHLQSCTSV